MHLHCLVLDDVYRRTEGEPVFQQARAPSRDESAGLLDKIIARLMKMLTRLGLPACPRAAALTGAAAASLPGRLILKAKAVLQRGDAETEKPA